MPELTNSVNLSGSIIANFNNVVLIFLFLAGIYQYPGLEYRLGIVFMLSIVPVTYMLISELQSDRTVLY